MLVESVVKNCDAICEEYILKKDVEKISIDSNDCENAIFVCLKGLNADGHDYAKAAIKNGAVAVVCEKQVDSVIPQILVRDCREALALISANFYHNCAKKMRIIGVTGTNGKTTTCYIIKSILEKAKRKVGVIGTLGVAIGNIKYDCNLTTPDPIELHKIFYEMSSHGVTDVVMEVSAHSIAFNKIAGIIFDVAIFTNLTQDHLDFFETMEKYGNAKKQLFTKQYCKTAVVNSDDEMGRWLIFNQKVPTVTYGLNNPADVFAINRRCKLTGNTFSLNMMDNYAEIKTHLVGEYNIYNTLAAITACALLDVDLDTIKKGLLRCKSVDGRFNIIKNRGYYIIIDFAHTPDGINKVLSTVKSACNGRVITVFGSAGNRDITKRPIMAREAEKFSDFVILTSDNPRYENPELIIDDVKKGFSKVNHFGIVDRVQAIQTALTLCRKNDCLVICGKGGEKYQDINGVKTPYSDYDTVIKLIKEQNNAG